MPETTSSSISTLYFNNTTERGIRRAAYLFTIQKIPKIPKIPKYNSLTKSKEKEILFYNPQNNRNSSNTNTMAKEVVEYYHEIFADHKLDEEENETLINFFHKLNPPPDIIIKIRASAFRVAAEHLSDDDDSINVSNLRCINAIVHAIETTCLE